MRFDLFDISELEAVMINEFFGKFEGWLAGLKKHNVGHNPYRLVFFLDAEAGQVYRTVLSFPYHWEWEGRKKPIGSAPGLEECLRELGAFLEGQGLGLSELKIDPLGLEKKLLEIGGLAVSVDCPLATVSFEKDRLDRCIVEVAGDGLSTIMENYWQTILCRGVDARAETMAEALDEAVVLIRRFNRLYREQKENQQNKIKTAYSSGGE